MKSLEDFRTHLNFEINQVQDPEVIYRTYYTITTPKIESKVHDLFESRGLSTKTSDFSFFINEILPLNHYSVEENNAFLKKMIDGTLISGTYLQDSEQRTRNLRDLVDPEVQTPVLEKLISHIGNSLSSSSVGKGEFAFALLTGGASKAQKGGDLKIDGNDIEIKAMGAKLSSQSSHISMMAILHEVQAEYPDLEIKPISNKNFRKHYLPILGFEGLKKFLHFIFSKTMFKNNDFEWILTCQSTEEFFKLLAIKEFHYYKDCDKFDKILFINPENLNIYTTDTMDFSQLENFKLGSSFSFNTERIQTNTWVLK